MHTHIHTHTHTHTVRAQPHEQELSDLLAVRALLNESMRNRVLTRALVAMRAGCMTTNTSNTHAILRQRHLASAAERADGFRVQGGVEDNHPLQDAAMELWERDD
eukprot:5979520-Amphidinium_carterae.1